MAYIGHFPSDLRRSFLDDPCAKLDCPTNTLLPGGLQEALVFLESRSWLLGSCFCAGFSHGDATTFPWPLARTRAGIGRACHAGLRQHHCGKYPYLERRAVCLVVPGIEPDSTEFIISDNNVPISNFHPEKVARVAEQARTVFEYDPNARPDSVRYLPAPYNELTCPERFSPLPSKDATTRSLPEASVDLLVHEPRPETVPRSITEKLASCPSPSSGKLKPIEHTMSFNVYVTNSGQAVSALVAQSTLGDRKTETCLVNVLRNTQWPELATPMPAVAAGPAPLASKLFVADGPPNLPDLTDLWKQIQKGPTPSII